jgi:hypothetical protein
MVALLFAVLVLEVRRARFTVPTAQPTTGQYQA